MDEGEYTQVAGKGHLVTQRKAARLSALPVWQGWFLMAMEHRGAQLNAVWAGCAVSPPSRATSLGPCPGLDPGQECRRAALVCQWLSPCS